MVLLKTGRLSAILALAIPASATEDTGDFDIVNGQIYTPGLAIVDAPQPFTPLGGGKFHFSPTDLIVFVSPRTPLDNA